MNKIKTDRFSDSPYTSANSYNDFCEALAEKFTEDFWEENEDWICNSDISMNWHNTLISKYVCINDLDEDDYRFLEKINELPKYRTRDEALTAAAKLYVRAFNIYIKNK